MTSKYQIGNLLYFHTSVRLLIGIILERVWTKDKKSVSGYKAHYRIRWFDTDIEYMYFESEIDDRFKLV